MPSFLRIAVVAAALLQSVAASTVFESLSGVPEGWTFARQAKDDERIQLRVAVKQQNVARFEQILLDVSTPDHPSYGKHLEGHEVKAMLAPTEKASSSVVSWLQDHNVTAIEEDGYWVTFATQVGTANKLLDTEFAWFKSDYRGQERLRTLEYSVPETIAEHINFVQPTIRFGSLKPQRESIMKMTEAQMAEARDPPPVGNTLNVTYCNKTIVPNCLLNLYNVRYQANATNGNKVAFASFLEQYARYKDLDDFEKVYAPYAANQSFDVVEFNGGLNDQVGTENSGEANLDAQYVKGLSAPVPMTEFSTGGRGLLVPDLDQPTQADNNNEPYLDYLIGLSKLPNSALPQTISHSYGENEQSVPESYVRQVCQMFGELGARGVSILFSSGDSGVGDACLSNDGKNTTEFQPQFPAACPWVTSVGGTYRVKPERAIYFSSGGFSRLFPRPKYQDDAVSDFLDILGDRFAGYFNRQGRGFPDVAAQSYFYLVQDQGSLGGYQGTSCASPTFAGIVSLLNSARLSSNLPPLGFLNPWIYSSGRHGLNDITVGGNTGCTGNSSFHGPPNGSPYIPYAGFNATKGWDPVTGYGTPNFGKLLKMVAPGVENTGGPVQRKP